MTPKAPFLHALQERLQSTHFARLDIVHPSPIAYMRLRQLIILVAHKLNNHPLNIHPSAHDYNTGILFTALRAEFAGLRH